MMEKIDLNKIAIDGRFYVQGIPVFSRKEVTMCMTEAIRQAIPLIQEYLAKKAKLTVDWKTDTTNPTVILDKSSITGISTEEILKQIL